MEANAHLVTPVVDPAAAVMSGDKAGARGKHQFRIEGFPSRTSQEWLCGVLKTEFGFGFSSGGRGIQTAKDGHKSWIVFSDDGPRKTRFRVKNPYDNSLVTMWTKTASPPGAGTLSWRSAETAVRRSGAAFVPTSKSSKCRDSLQFT